MRGVRNLFAVVLSGLLVAGPGLAQDDDVDIDGILEDMPEGDFEMPDGDFDAPEGDDDVDEPAKKPKRKKPKRKKPKAKPAPEPEPEVTPEEEDPTAGLFVDEPAETTRKPAPAPAPKPAPKPAPTTEAPRRRLLVDPGAGAGSRRPVGAVEEDTVDFPVEEPPETEGADTVVWVATGVGTAVGVAVLAGLGVGAVFLMNPLPGPTGSITVTPR